ncbi:hypothetical protein [Flavobacterium sp.]|uniref:hypothetical protein n=1 Tax=Flavobacterium sp. TaxID=239 RepID=UPI0037516AB3
MKTENNTLIILAIVSITFTGILTFYAFKKARKISQMSEVERKNEMGKINNRTGNSLFLKHILEIIGSIYK